MTTVPVNENWAETALVTLGNTYWVRYEKPDFYHYLKLRVAYIMGNEIGVEYLIIDTKAKALTLIQISVINPSIRLR